MSFEFYGGLLVLDLLEKEGAPKQQAESVAEAIIRHQDLGDVGNITTVGALVQLATLFGEWKSSISCLVLCSRFLPFLRGDLSSRGRGGV